MKKLQLLPKKKIEGSPIKVTLECELGTAPEHGRNWIALDQTSWYRPSDLLTPVDTIKKDGCVIVGNAIASKTGRS